MECSIGSTNLRQQLTDVLEVVREERVAFFTWLDETAAQNAGQNAAMSEAEVLALIEQARTEAAQA